MYRSTRGVAFLLATALATTACAGEQDDATAGEAEGAFTLGGKAWLAGGVYDLPPRADGATGTLLVRKGLLGYEISATMFEGSSMRVHLPAKPIVTDGEARLTSSIGCKLVIRPAANGALAVSQDGACGDNPLRLDGTFAPRDHEKVLGTYSDGSLTVAITRSTDEAITFSLRVTGARPSGYSGDAEIESAALVTTDAITATCRIALGNPEAPYTRLFVLPSGDCRSIGLDAPRYVLSRR